MVVFLNVMLPLLIAAILFVGYKRKKIVPAIVLAIVTAVGYSLVQPSYIPKGTVPAMRIVESTPVETQIIDRTKKVMSSNERDARMEKQKEESAKRRAMLMEKRVD